MGALFSNKWTFKINDDQNRTLLIDEHWACTSMNWWWCYSGDNYGHDFKLRECLHLRVRMCKSEHICEKRWRNERYLAPAQYLGIALQNTFNSIEPDEGEWNSETHRIRDWLLNSMQIQRSSSCWKGDKYWFQEFYMCKPSHSQL